MKSRFLGIFIFAVLILAVFSVALADDSVEVTLISVEPDELPSGAQVQVKLQIENNSDYELTNLSVVQNGISYVLPEGSVVPHPGTAQIPLTVDVQDSQLDKPIVFEVGWFCDGEPFSKKVETTIRRVEEPVISLSREMDQTYAKKDQKVVLTYVLRNETKFDMTDIVLSDDEICSQPIQKIQTLQAGNSLTFQYTFTMDEETAVSNPSVSYSVNGMNRTITPLDPVKIEYVLIQTQVTAETGAVSAEGTTVNLVVSNNGNQKLRKITISDDSRNVVNTVPFSLAAGDKQTLSYTVSNPMGGSNKTVSFILSATDPFGEPYEEETKASVTIQPYIDASMFNVSMTAEMNGPVDEKNGLASIKVTIQNNSTADISNAILFEQSLGTLATYLSLQRGQTVCEGQVAYKSQSTLTILLKCTDVNGNDRDLASCTLDLTAQAEDPLASEIPGTLTTDAPTGTVASGFNSIVTRILIVLGAIVVLACAVLLILSFLEKNHVGENAFLQEVRDEENEGFDDEFDSIGVDYRGEDNEYESSGFGGPADYYRRSQLYIDDQRDSMNRRRPDYDDTARDDRQEDPDSWRPTYDNHSAGFRENSDSFDQFRRPSKDQYYDSYGPDGERYDGFSEYDRRYGDGDSYDDRDAHVNRNDDFDSESELKDILSELEMEESGQMDENAGNNSYAGDNRPKVLKVRNTPQTGQMNRRGTVKRVVRSGADTSGETSAEIETHREAEDAEDE